jgi:hypothetical protein
MTCALGQKIFSKKICKSIVELENDSTFAAALNARHESKGSKNTKREV